MRHLSRCRSHAALVCLLLVACGDSGPDVTMDASSPSHADGAAPIDGGSSAAGSAGSAAGSPPGPVAGAPATGGGGTSVVPVALPDGGPGASEGGGDGAVDGPEPEPELVKPQLATRHNEVCYLAESGALTCWAKDRPGSAKPGYDPTYDPPPGVRFRRVCAGVAASCALGVDGEIRCWGTPDLGILNPPPGPFAEVTCGDIDACALRRDGSAACWGGADVAATKVVPPGASFVQIITIARYACGRRSNGEVQCWGRMVGDKGALVEAVSPVGRFRLIEAGRDQHTCGVKDDDSVVCWGRPGAPMIANGDWVDFGISGPVACALDREGNVRCFGDLTQPRAQPPAGYTFASIDLGRVHACALTTAGKVVCWGEGNSVAKVPPALAAPAPESPQDASVD